MAPIATMASVGGLSVAVTFIAPLDVLTVATAASATARHEDLPWQAMAFSPWEARSPDQVCTLPVAVEMTALLPLSDSSRPTVTHVFDVGQAMPFRPATPGTGVPPASGPGAAAAATPAAVTDQVRMAMLVAATANRNRVLGTLVLPPLLTGLAGPLYGYASCWAISSYSSPVGGSAAATDSADGHFLSSTCGISQVARKARAAIGTATMKTVWIDSAYPATKPWW